MSDKTFTRAFASVRVWYNKRYKRHYFTARIQMDDGTHLRSGYVRALPDEGEQGTHLFRGVTNMIAEAGYEVPEGESATWYKLYANDTFISMDVVSVARKQDLHYCGTALRA